jgi:PiT family inorganic phosphate transporter
MEDGDSMGFLISLAVCAVIFVNGATDAVNSISGAVASGAFSYRRACVICALCNFLGLVLSCTFCPAVANSIASLKGSDSIVPLLTVVIFSASAWALGIPTSESHALIAAMGGVALYRFGVTGGSFIDICIKSFCSCILGFVAGWVAFALWRRRTTSRRQMHTIQRLCAVLSSACHGMQDGQKFTVLLASSAAVLKLNVGSILICGAVMALGCLSGGRRITETVGEELVLAETDTCNAASDLSAALCTAAVSLFGIPVSTTYMKTCSMLGCAAAGRLRVSKRVTARFFLVWTLTYPICMAIAYLLCLGANKLF